MFRRILRKAKENDGKIRLMALGISYLLDYLIHTEIGSTLRKLINNSKYEYFGFEGNLQDLIGEDGVKEIASDLSKEVQEKNLENIVDKVDGIAGLGLLALEDYEARKARIEKPKYKISRFFGYLISFGRSIRKAAEYLYYKVKWNRDIKVNISEYNGPLQNDENLRKYVKEQIRDHLEKNFPLFQDYIFQKISDFSGIIPSFSIFGIKIIFSLLAFILIILYFLKKRRGLRRPVSLPR